MRKVPFAIGVALIAAAAGTATYWYFSHGRAPAAPPAPIEQLQARVNADPGSVPARLELAAAYRDTGWRSRALDEFRRAAALVPDYVPARVAIAGLSFEMGWYSQASEEAEQILNREPLNLEAQAIRAVSLAFNCDYRGAIACLDDLTVGPPPAGVPLEYDPPRPQAAAWLGLDVPRDPPGFYRRPSQSLLADARRAQMLIQLFAPQLEQAENQLMGGFNLNLPGQLPAWEAIVRRRLLCDAVLAWAHLRLGELDMASLRAEAVVNAPAEFRQIAQAHVLGELMHSRILQMNDDPAAAVKSLQECIDKFLKQEFGPITPDTASKPAGRVARERAAVWRDIGALLAVQGQPDEAIRALEEAAEYDPADTAINLPLANACLLAGRFERAVHMAADLLAQRVDSPSGRMLHAMALCKRYQVGVEQSRRIAASARQIEREDRERGREITSLRKAELRKIRNDSVAAQSHALSELQEAQSEVDRILKEQPGFWPAHSFGAFLLAQGRGAEAERIFEAGCTAGPQHARHWIGLALARQLDGRDEAALQALAQGIEALPRDERLHEVNLLIVLGAARTEQAKALLLREDRLPADLRAMYAELAAWPPRAAASGALGLARGVVFMLYGHDADAQLEFSAAAELCPDSSVTLLWLARDLTEAGQLDEAIEAASRLCEAAPKLAAARACLGDARRRAGDLQGAVEAYRVAVSLEPRWPRYHEVLGAALRASGDAAGAAAEYQAAISNGSSDPQTLAELALLLAGDAQQLARATGLAEQAAAADPTNPRTMLAKGTCLLAQRKLDEALPLLEAASAGMVRSAEAHLQLGRCLSAAGQIERARRSLRAADKLDPNGPFGRQATELLRSLPVAQAQPGGK